MIIEKKKNNKLILEIIKQEKKKKKVDVNKFISRRIFYTSPFFFSVYFFCSPPFDGYICDGGALEERRRGK